MHAHDLNRLHHFKHTNRAPAETIGADMINFFKKSVEKRHTKLSKIAECWGLIVPEMLNDHCVEPQFTCRVRWQPGQLVIWDNRCTLHNAINDYHGYRREMRRLTVGAERPR